MRGTSWRFLYLELLNDFCGSAITYYRMQYSYIIDVTSVTERTFRLAIVEGTDYASVSMGNLISGPLFVSIGYFGVFGLASSCNVIALLYLVFFIKESVHKTKSEADKSNNEGKHDEEKTSSRSFCKIIKTSVLYVLEGVKTVIKKRDGYRRLFVFLGIFIYTMTIFVYSGTEGSTRIYYSQNKYKLTANEVTSLMFVAKIGCWISLWVLLPFMKKVLKLSDSTTALVAIISTSTGFILPVCTGTTQWFKVGSFVGNWFSLSLIFCSLSPSLMLIIR